MLLIGVPQAVAQCIKSQGSLTSELLVNGGNSDGTFTYVWGVTFDEPNTWLTQIWFQSSGDVVTSPTVQPDYTTWTYSQVASAPVIAQPAELFTFQSGFKLQRGRTFTFAYTTSFTDPVQVRAVDNLGNPYTVSFNSATCGNLPVELGAFEARADGNAALVVWETLSETNNAGFTVEMRETHAGAFRALGFVPGAGTTAEVQRYQFQTPTLAPGRYEFRLQQVDFDGATEYSPSVLLEIVLDGAVHVRPFASVLRDATPLVFSVARADRVAADLFNLLGQRVGSVYSGAVAAGETVQTTLDVSALPAGVYFLRIQGSTFARTERITVVR